MTIAYSDSFTKLLFRWKGSIYKSIWLHLMIFLLIYYSINIWLRVGATGEQQKEFLKFRKYCNDSVLPKIPLIFLLGFYISVIVARWWDQFNYIAWPDRFIMMLSSFMSDKGEQSRLIRRTIARWCNLASVMSWRSISVRILRRFPTYDHICKAGLMTEKELEVLNNTDNSNGQYFLPVLWIQNLIKHAQTQGYLNILEACTLIEEAQKYRLSFGMLLCYDWVQLPLVYTQVVTLATYGYFAIIAIADQTFDIKFERKSGEDDYSAQMYDTYIPIFTILQFLFYMGCLRVAEVLMNPFGEDDDDFEMNYILDRNMSVAWMLADTVHGQMPQPEPDMFVANDKVALPYTLSSLKRPDNIFPGHLVNFKLKEGEMLLVPPDEFDQYVQVPSTQKFENLVKLVQKGRQRKKQNAVEEETENLNVELDNPFRNSDKKKEEV